MTSFPLPPPDKLATRLADLATVNPGPSAFEHARGAMPLDTHWCRNNARAALPSDGVLPEDARAALPGDGVLPEARPPPRAARPRATASERIVKPNARRRRSTIAVRPRASVLLIIYPSDGWAAPTDPLTAFEQAEHYRTSVYRPYHAIQSTCFDLLQSFRQGPSTISWTKPRDIAGWAQTLRVSGSASAPSVAARWVQQRLMESQAWAATCAPAAWATIFSATWAGTSS